MKTTQPCCILITGASSGIGAALAVYYAKPGCTLFLSARNQIRLEAIVTQCETQGASVNSQIIDVTDATTLAQWIVQCDEQQPIDLIIANAGISNAGKTLTCAANQTIFDVNVQGVLNTIHPIIPRMQQRRRGQIALISSLAGFRGMPRSPAYSASKAAIRVYGDALGGLLMGDGITVSVVCPGFIKTALTDKNDFQMPLLQSADKAAAYIGKKLAAKKMLIVFPWRMFCLVWLLMVMPTRWARKIGQQCL